MRRIHITIKGGTLFLFFFIFLLLNSAHGQIRIGEWRDHYPYRESVSLTDQGDIIYCATEKALFSFHKADYSIGKLSQVHGLSDIKISFIKYNIGNQLLLVAYQNGNIDLIQGDKVINLSDIYRSSVAGKKTIYNALFTGNLAYLSCDFGIVVLDLEKKEFKDTYYIGENGEPFPVYDLALLNQNLYAATKSGILTGNINDPLLIDFNHWTKINNIPGSNRTFNSILTLNNSIYVNQTTTLNGVDSVFISDGTQWSFYAHTNGLNHSLNTGNGKLLISSEKSLSVYNNSPSPEFVIDSYGWGKIQPWQAIIDSEETLWIADHTHTLIKGTDFQSFEHISPNGPYVSNVFSMNIGHNTVWVVGGGLTNLWGNLWRNGEIHSFKDGLWESNIVYTVKDLVRVISHPSEPDHIFVASWGNGLIEISDKEVLNVYNQDNSSLQHTSVSDDDVRVFGLLFDRSNNLWVTNSLVNKPISVKTSAGDWKSFRFGGKISGITLGDIIETRYGDKWVSLPRNGGLFIFNENQTIENESDDLYRRISVVDQNGKSYQDITSLTTDLDGNIWIGTKHGPLVYYGPSEILYNGSAIAQKVKIPRNDGSGLADYLLSTEEITAIAIDGANRKWFGTRAAGVFLFSEDGTREIKSFNKESSPLPTNWITAISIDHKTGEVFIGTEDGTLSYRSTATAGSEEMTQVYTFPNPVREDYEGPITITGLTENSNVKITDISGNIVFETESLGGQAIWDGRNTLKERVHTGVYMVFISNSDGSKTFVTKILFIH